MRRLNNAVALVALLALLGVGLSACGDTTVIYQTAAASPTATLRPTATKAPTPHAQSSPPPGIWCPVQQGLTPLVVNCEIYPSDPQLATPPQGEAYLAGTQVGPAIGDSGPSTVTESMSSPWAADVICWTNDGSSAGQVRIMMVAHSSSGAYYSWGLEPCGPPSAPDYGNEFFRKASVTVTLSIQPLTGNLGSWSAELLQL